MGSAKRDEKADAAEQSGNTPKRKAKDGAGTVGRALRTVYDDMLREEVPKDFLDLLGKLD